MNSFSYSAARQRREELADFLKSRRHRIAPCEVGLPESPRKRTPGLRREDVAELAGLSDSWYMRLEQARDINVSDESLAAIADALRLNRDERSHLFRLAKPNEESRQKQMPNDVDLAEVKRVIETFSPLAPAIATGKYMDLLAWNEAAGELHDDFRVLPANRLNWAWYVFKYKQPEFFNDWKTFARCTLAVVRNEHGKYLGTADENISLINELSAESAHFNEWWNDHEVVNLPNPNKIFVHPTKQELRYKTLTMRLESVPQVRFVVYTPLAGED
jgi:transcriptional regulator with XRE-family HTH domain